MILRNYCITHSLILTDTCEKDRVFWWRKRVTLISVKINWRSQSTWRVCFFEMIELIKEFLIAPILFHATELLISTHIWASKHQKIISDKSFKKYLLSSSLCSLFIHNLTIFLSLRALSSSSFSHSSFVSERERREIYKYRRVRQHIVNVRACWCSRASSWYRLLLHLSAVADNWISSFPQIYLNFSHGLHFLKTITFLCCMGKWSISVFTWFYWCFRLSGSSKCYRSLSNKVQIGRAET